MDSNGEIDGVVDSPISENLNNKGEGSGRSSFELLKSKTRSSFDLAGRAKKTAKHFIEDTLEEGKQQIQRSRKNSVNGLESPVAPDSPHEQESASGRRSFDKLKKVTTSTFDPASKAKKRGKDKVKKYSLKMKEKKQRKSLSNVPEKVPEDHDADIPDTPISEKSSGKGSFEHLLPSITQGEDGDSLHNALKLSMPGSFPESSVQNPSVDKSRGSLDNQSSIDKPNDRDSLVIVRENRDRDVDDGKREGNKFNSRRERVKQIRRTAHHAVAAIGIFSAGTKSHKHEDEAEDSLQEGP
jgi:hypothetical protein